MGEAEKSSKVSVGQGKVVVVSGGELLVNDWSVRWPKRRGKRRDKMKGSGKLSLIFFDEFTMQGFSHMFTLSLLWKT